MAKRNYRKSSKKIQPAVLTMSFNVPIKGSSKEAFFVDLSQCASIVNRRFYRQGLNWAVGGFKFFTSSGATGQVQIQKLPNTWVMSNAWEKGFRHWMKMNTESLEAAESIKPKFLDFKIYANDDHHKSGYGANLLPLSGASLTLPVQEATPGEWIHSTFHIPDTSKDSSNPVSNNPRSVIAVGPNYTAAGDDGQFAVSLIEGYAASRGLPNIQDPNAPNDAASINQSTAQNWLAALDNDFDKQTGEVISDMLLQNDIAPYPFENDGVHTDTMYPGGANQMKTLEIHDGEYVTSTTIGGTTRIKGGNFPCGLIALNLANYDGQDLRMQIDLIPGTHRGYLAEPMTDM